MKPPTSRAVTYVIPTRNSESIVEQTLIKLNELGKMRPETEVILVENGSTDSTIPVIERLLDNFAHISVTLLRASNYGEAIRIGVKRARNERVLISADDLPFEFSDLYQFDICDADVLLGSKSDPRSKTVRKFHRRLMTIGFHFLTRRILGIHDEVNGTIEVRDKGRSIVDRTTEIGFGISMEIMYLAEKADLKNARVPVIYNKGEEVSRVRIFRDSLDLVNSMIRIRRRHG